MFKKISLLLLCTLAMQLNAQVRYQKFYDKEQRHTAVEGMMSDDSVRIGQWTWWHQNGKVYQQGTYNDRGEKTGVWKQFYDDGSRCAVECYGTGTSQEWYRNGTLKSEIRVKDGKKNGTYRSWYENGKQKDEIVFVNGLKQGTSKEWHENGKIKFEGTYKDNELNGNAVWWTENGFIDMKGRLENGEQQGEWLFYWRTNGKLGIRGNYDHGVETGVWTYYYETGEKWREGNYVAGD